MADIGGTPGKKLSLEQYEAFRKTTRPTILRRLRRTFGAFLGLFSPGEPNLIVMKSYYNYETI